MKILIKNRKLFYEVICIVGLLSLVIFPFIAVKTLIEFLTPLIIFLATGLISFLIEKEKYNKTYGYRNYLVSFIHLVFSFGGISLLLFFTVNYTFKSKINETKTFEILDWKSSFGGKNERNVLHPDFTILYKGKNKVISFPKEFFSDRKNFKEIELKTSKGFLGFEILIEKKLK